MAGMNGNRKSGWLRACKALANTNLCKDKALAYFDLIRKDERLWR